MLPSRRAVEGGGSVTRGLPELDMADLELLEIDGDTRPAAFRRELRWNHAYYFLDSGV
jgi:L-arabinose isomerase